VAPPARSLTLLVVPHTHWDREWYHTAERFRQRLVALIDELLDDPPPAGESFLLDGQAIVLEDFLAIRPERAAELSALLRDGRIEAGPWYVLADELIPSGEALVRNLLAGREVVRRMRGEPPPVLYCPDSFGHPAILPELARGFGCELIVLWRGYGGPRWPAGDTVRWRGPTGAEVIVHHLPPDGYEFGSTLPIDPGAAAERWMRVVTVMAPRATTGVALLLNGADHHARQLGQRDAVAALATVARPDVIRASTLRDAAATIAERTRDVSLPVIEGELRDSYGYTWTLQGTFGTRAAQKRRNAIAERLLVRDVEPWIALTAADNGATRALLAEAWRTLLRGHPHDTLCGTSIDAVAAALDERLATTMVQGVGLRDDALHTLIAHDSARARAELDAWRPVVMLRNPAPRPRRGVAQLHLSATIAHVAVGPGSGDRQGAPRRIPPWGVDGIPLQTLDRGEHVALTEDPRSYPRADRVATAHAVGWVDHIDGYSVVTRAQKRRARVDVPNPVVARERELDNGLARVTVSDDGCVRLEDRASARTIDDLIVLEDRRDVGDLYTPALRESLSPWTLRRVRLVHRGPLRGEIALEYAAASRGRCIVRVQLDANLPALRVRVQGENRATGHRLRIRFATDLAGATTIADAAFHPVSRVPLALSDEEQRMEHVIPAAPLHRWVARFTPDAGATLFSDGLAEYESGDDGSIAVTLVRAVGALSRHDLPERPGNAGWPADTPGAQSLGAFDASFAIALHGGDSPGVRDTIEQLADDVLLPITGETLRSNLQEARAAGGLELAGDGLVFSAAKPAQRAGWIALRCVNRRDVAVEGTWRFRASVAEAVRARLDEMPGEPLRVEGSTVRFEAAPREIVTLLVRLAE
jgi:alpha-mannosidase